MLQRRVNPDFPYTRSNGWHRLPIERVQTLLDTPELEACKSPGVPREGPNVAARGAEPLERLLGRDSIYEYRYTLSSPTGAGRITTRCSGRTRGSRPVQEGRTGRAGRRRRSLAGALLEEMPCERQWSGGSSLLLSDLPFRPLGRMRSRKS